MSSVMPPLDMEDDAFAPLPGPGVAGSAADPQVAQLRVPPHSMESGCLIWGKLII